MKKILILFATLFVGIVAAHAISVNWYVDGSLYDTTTCTAGDSITPPTAPTKRGYTFVEWAAYAPIEYIESTGTQYINTGIIPSDHNGLQWELDVTPVTTVSTWNFIAGSQINANAYAHCVGPVFNGTKISWGGGLWIDTQQNIRYGTRYKFFVKVVNGDSVLKLNNTEISRNTSNITLSPYALYLFANNASNTTQYYAAAKVYSLKIWNGAGSTLLRDMIPVLDVFDTPCMYDKVSETFFYNTGTGSFVAGPAI